MTLAILSTLISSPIFTSLLAMFGAPAAGSIILMIFNSKAFLGIAGHGMNIGKTIGIGLAAWAETGPLKAIFGPFIYLFVFAVCFAWSILDGLMSKLKGANLQIAQSLESLLLQGDSSARLGYVQAKIDNAANPTAGKEIEKAIESPATVLEAGQTAALETAIEAGGELQAARVAS